MSKDIDLETELFECCQICPVCSEKVRLFVGKDENLEKALLCIQAWANAYPLNIFPKPDLKKAAQVLKDNGMTLGSISADNMRHVLDGIKGIVDQALKDDNEEAKTT